MSSRLLKPAVALLVATVVLCAGRAAFAVSPMSVDGIARDALLVSHLDELSDPGGKLTLDNVRAPDATGWRPCGPAIPNYGISTDAHWFRFALSSSLDRESRLLLEIPHPGIDRVELYVFEGGAWRTMLAGDLVPYEQWAMPHREPLFPLTIGPKSTNTYYMRVVSTGVVQVDARLWKRAAFEAQSSALELRLGVYYGALAIMLLYNLFLFYSVRDKNYLAYVGYIGGILGLTVAMDGTGYLVLWPGYAWLNAYAFPFFVAMALSSGIGFALGFLGVRSIYPRAFRAGLAMILLGLAAGAVSLVSFSASVRALAALTVVMLCLVYVLGVLSWRRGVRTAGLYLLGWTVPIAGLLILIADKFGALNPSDLTEGTMRVGAILEALIFSFALPIRINEIRESRDAIEAESRAKTRFFANVSHELRTPLMLVLAPIQAVLAETANDAHRQLLEAARANAQRLLRQVNMLLEVARLDHGSIDLRLAPGSLADVVRDMVEAAMPYAKAKSVQLRSEALERIPSSEFDLARMETIVGNLLSNALKFTPPDGAVVVRYLDAGPAKVGFEVEDSGPGISHADLDVVFHRFERGGAAGKHLVEGTGLGLALVRELVEAHGGAVSVRSSPGRGSAFAVSLPIHPRPPGASFAPAGSVDDQLAAHLSGLARRSTLLSDVEPARLTTRPAAASHGASSRPLVLLVDDHDDLRAVVARGLSPRYRVEQASNGLVAWEKACRLRPDCVVSDVMMPEMDGLELVRKMRGDELLGATPIILATARAERDDALAGLEMGADDYVVKPFDLAELGARVAAVLRTRELQRALDDRDSRLAEIGRATGQIVHDVRNPLSSIVVLAASTAHQLDEVGTLPELRENLAMIQQAAERIESLAGQILEYSKASSLALRPRPVRVQLLMTSLLRSWQTTLSDAGIELTTTLSVQPRQLVALDSDRFARLVDNLLSNARDAVQQAGAARRRRIHVAIGRDRALFRLRVADSGPGVDESIRNTLFEPFVSSGKRKGTGLGLAIVAEVARAHGGTVTVSTDDDLGGAAFTVELPCDTAGASPQLRAPGFADS